MGVVFFFPLCCSFCLSLAALPMRLHQLFILTWGKESLRVVLDRDSSPRFPGAPSFPAVTAVEYKGLIKECCHVTVTNTVWNRDVWRPVPTRAMRHCALFVCVCVCLHCWMVMAKAKAGEFHGCLGLHVAAYMSQRMYFGTFATRFWAARTAVLLVKLNSTKIKMNNCFVFFSSHSNIQIFGFNHCKRNGNASSLFPWRWDLYVDAYCNSFFIWNTQRWWLVHNKFDAKTIWKQMSWLPELTWEQLWCHHPLTLVEEWLIRLEIHVVTVCRCDNAKMCTDKNNNNKMYSYVAVGCNQGIVMFIKQIPSCFLLHVHVVLSLIYFFPPSSPEARRTNKLLCLALC